MSEERVLAALAELKEADLEQEAGPVVEARLIDAYRKRKVRRVWRHAAAWSGAAAAALAAIIFISRPSVPREAAPDRVAANAGQLASPTVEFPAVEGAARRPARAGRTAPSARPARREVVTQFFPLMDVPPPFEHGELVRVVVPAATMQSVGLPVSPDQLTEPVEAEVLVGQEGLARAIRFVNFQ